MPKSTLPFSVPIKASAAPEAPGVPETWATPEVPETPETPRVPTPPGKEVFAMLNRLLASFARADAVHQARLDEFWGSPNGHLVLHYTRSVK